MSKAVLHGLVGYLEEQNRKAFQANPVGGAPFLSKLLDYVWAQTTLSGTSIVARMLERHFDSFTPSPAIDRYVERLAAKPVWQNPADAFNRLADLLIREDHARRAEAARFERERLEPEHAEREQKVLEEFKAALRQKRRVSTGEVGVYYELREGDVWLRLKVDRDYLWFKPLAESSIDEAVAERERLVQERKQVAA